MAIKQLTVFIQNKKGTVVSVTDILSKNNQSPRTFYCRNAGFRYSPFDRQR